MEPGRPGASDDAFLGGRLKILQPAGGYRAATDPVLLAASVAAGQSQTVLELGCGVGVASLCLAWRTGAQVTGLELQPVYADLARENARRNGLRLNVIEGDLERMPPALRARCFDHVMFNPPFFARGDGTVARDEGRETANRESTPLCDWVSAGLRRLAPGGWITVIHRADRLPDLLCAFGNRVGAVSVLPIGARIGRPAGRVLVRARKGSRTPFTLLPAMILHEGSRHGSDGDDYSQTTSGILRNGAALPW